ILFDIRGQSVDLFCLQRDAGRDPVQHLANEAIAFVLDIGALQVKRHLSAGNAAFDDRLEAFSVEQAGAQARPGWEMATFAALAEGAVTVEAPGAILPQRPPI